jgi:putative component of membrane protein insertase Oxa1/YidC/SpoIIIJ protein YidD
MKKLTIISILLIISKIVIGQEDDLITSYYHQFDVNRNETSYKEHTTKDSEAKVVASFFFLFYKEYISSQDINTCVFTPSCSVYAMESIKKLGLLEGLVNAFDRLTRCHPMAQKYYPIDPQTQRLYDPVPDK